MHRRIGIIIKNLTNNIIKSDRLFMSWIITSFLFNYYICILLRCMFSLQFRNSFFLLSTSSSSYVAYAFASFICSLRFGQHTFRRRNTISGASVLSNYDIDFHIYEDRNSISAIQFVVYTISCSLLRLCFSCAHIHSHHRSLGQTVATTIFFFLYFPFVVFALFHSFYLCFVVVVVVVYFTFRHKLHR